MVVCLVLVDDDDDYDDDVSVREQWSYVQCWLMKMIMMMM